MNYMGNKRRIVNEIMPFLTGALKPGQSYVEPFCGSCSVIQKFPKDTRRIANDNNRYLIAMWKALTDGSWKPPLLIPKTYYNEVRTSYRADDGKFSDALIGWVGFMASRNGRFFDGGYSGYDFDGRDYISENIRNITAQIPELKGIEWQAGDYSSMTIPDSSLIYCDPPYKDTKAYSTSKNFDYQDFYDWCRTKATEGHTVFVSEYSMPPDFKPVWRKQVTVAMGTYKTYHPTETLFVI
mgnify:CR=1 FL=1